MLHSGDTVYMTSFLKNIIGYIQVKLTLINTNKLKTNAKF